MDISELAMLLDTMSTGEVDQELFSKACEISKNIPNLSDEARLQLYGLYKQGTIGNINTAKPFMIDIVGCAKWDAWKSFEGFPKDAAAKAYIYLVQTCCGEANQDTYSADDGTNAFNGFNSFGVSLGTIKYTSNGPDGTWRSDQEIFSAVTDEDFEKLEKIVSNFRENVNMRDQDEMTPLHYAVDRGLYDTANYLIQNGANVNSQDCNGETPLMLAVICEHEDLIRLLLTNNADKTIKNKEGLTILDFDVSEEIKSITLY